MGVWGGGGGGGGGANPDGTGTNCGTEVLLVATSEAIPAVVTLNVLGEGLGIRRGSVAWVRVETGEVKVGVEKKLRVLGSAGVVCASMGERRRD